jgi:NTE family protein
MIFSGMVMKSLLEYRDPFLLLRASGRLMLWAVLFILSTGCFCPHHFVPKQETSTLRPCRVPEHIRVALVLGSGGVRGIAHVGVLEEFEKAGIPVDLIVGCSAGSIVGALYADNPNAAYVKQILTHMRRTNLLDINLWNCRFGLSQGAMLSRTLEKYLEASTFDELKIPFVTVASDLNSGELVPIGSGDIVKAVRASSSIPLVFVPVELDGRILVDGGVIDPVPVRVARDLGAQFVIAVDLRELLPQTFPTNLFGVAKRSTEIAFLWYNESCIRGADVVIRPKMCDIGTFDDSKNKKIYQAGRQAARDAMARIKELIGDMPQKSRAENPCKIVELACYSAE